MLFPTGFRRATSAQWERPRLGSPPKVRIIRRLAGEFGERSKLIIIVGGGHIKPDPPVTRSDRSDHYTVPGFSRLGTLGERCIEATAGI